MPCIDMSAAVAAWLMLDAQAAPSAISPVVCGVDAMSVLC